MAEKLKNGIEILVGQAVLEQNIIFDSHLAY